MAKQHSCMLSFDLEDWFQVENLQGAVPKKDWATREYRVEESAQNLLDLLDKAGAKATFFVLGWVAEKTPGLVKQIRARGHEIACHGYGHDLIYRMDPQAFREDIRKSKGILEEITQEKVRGYRAPSFSITEWAIDILKEEGFTYDSSAFPVTAHDRYGKLSTVDGTSGACIQEIRKGFYEICLGVLRFGGLRMPWGGGGYFRILPYAFFKRGIEAILDKHSDFIFYLHPWELDPGQPRVQNVGALSRARHYWGLKDTERKLKRLLNDFDWVRIQDRLKPVVGSKMVKSRNKSKKGRKIQCQSI